MATCPAVFFSFGRCGPNGGQLQRHGGRERHGEGLSFGGWALPKELGGDANLIQLATPMFLICAWSYYFWNEPGSNWSSNFKLNIAAEGTCFQAVLTPAHLRCVAKVIVSIDRNVEDSWVPKCWRRGHSSGLTLAGMMTRQEEKLHPEEMPHFNQDDPRLSSVGWSHSQRCGFELKLKTCKNNLKKNIVRRSGFSAAHLSDGSDHWPEVGNTLYHFNQLTKNGDVQWMSTQHVTQAIGGSLPCRSLVYRFFS